MNICGIYFLWFRLFGFPNCCVPDGILKMFCIVDPQRKNQNTNVLVFPMKCLSYSWDLVHVSPLSCVIPCSQGQLVDKSNEKLKPALLPLPAHPPPQKADRIYRSNAAANTFTGLTSECWCCKRSETTTSNLKNLITSQSPAGVKC